MNRKQLLKLFKDRTGGKTVIDLKDTEPPAPFQVSRVQDYQMKGGGQ